MNRCIAYNKNNKKCRTKTPANELFCCEAHKPINKELFEEGCFVCYQKEFQPNELIYLKCKHVFHKECYQEWLKYSTYDTPVCNICLREVFTQTNKHKKIENKISSEKQMEIKKLCDIKAILLIYTYYNTK
jgi:hypothetical protein